MTTEPLSTSPTGDASPDGPAVGAHAGATVFGYPRQGRNRELKKALERYWRGGSSLDELTSAVAAVRAQRLTTLSGADLAEIPIGDFSLYDHMLDMICLLRAAPERFVTAVPDTASEQGWLDRYFAMARGNAEVAPLEMTKWFDTNYHYLVPELAADATFTLDPARLLAEIAEARSFAVALRPVLVGPFTFLKLAKSAADDGFAPLDLLDRLVPIYQDLLTRLRAEGIDWVQLDEPAAVTDLTGAELEKLGSVYRTLTATADRPKILVATYFGHLGEAAPVLVNSGIDGLAVDLTSRGRQNLDLLTALSPFPPLRLVAGVVDGRNVWRTDLDSALTAAQALADLVGADGRVDVAPSCSLLHVPHDVTVETDLDPRVADWLAFADQKLEEVVTLAKGLAAGTAAIADELARNRARRESRRTSPLIHDEKVRQAMAGVSPQQFRRQSAYPSRSTAQRERLGLPVLPTTTIGSFPQTPEVRRARAELRSGARTEESYREAMLGEIDRVLELQNDLGIDVLVHGEPERNDMVQYFAEQLTGVVFTQHGWVQSYGSRYVRPPIIVGDIARPAPMTVEWATYAQIKAQEQATDGDGDAKRQRRMKGMLTGPVTMLAWSFVRDDQPRRDTAFQMALALREEVLDLEQAGIVAIQVDEPALRETLPLREGDRDDYLAWAVEAFRLTTSGVADATQIHTHMCYAEFGDIMANITAMDADVISLEAARSRMEIVDELAGHGYPSEVGPGVWDIHSPRVPSVDEIVEHLRDAVRYLPAERLWVNPDCGLKTRGWPEVTASLTNMVAATEIVRAELARG